MMQWSKKESLYLAPDKKEAVSLNQKVRKQLLKKIPEKIANAIGYEIVEQKK